MKCPLTLDRGLSFGNGLCFGSKKYRVDSSVKGNSPHTMITDIAIGVGENWITENSHIISRLGVVCLFLPNSVSSHRHPHLSI